MNYCVAIDNLIQNKKWVRNDIGMAKVQFIKLISEKEKLKILITSNTLKGPIYSDVENIIAMNEQVTIFYDGEHCEVLREEEYEDFKGNIRKDEWDVLFHGDVTKDLYELGLVEKEKGFIAQAHKDIEHSILANVNVEASEEICKEFGLK
ncbi:MAG: hypothetical protein AB2417_03230 [Clostridiaceae bacterium]